MKITRLYAAESGESRFAEIDIPIEHPQQDADGNTLQTAGAIRATVGSVSISEDEAYRMNPFLMLWTVSGRQVMCRVNGGWKCEASEADE
jgi:hypothetical protein